jgi:integrase
MKTFTSRLGLQIERFLEHKHSLGLAYHREERFLSELHRLAQRRGDDLLSEDLVRAYLSCFSQAARPNRLTLIRQLARFLCLEEPSTFVPSTRFLGIHRRRPMIRVLSREEASRFLDACDRLPDCFSFTQRVVHATALRLLLLTGLRCGEALALRNRQVDLVDRLLTVTGGKGGKTRFVPLAEDLTHRLQAYLRCLATRWKTRRAGDPFFPRANGRQPTSRPHLYNSFRQVLDVAGIEHGGRGEGPRMHDLRHSFAVLRLLSWYEAGADLGTKLPLLSAYLGHVSLASSQVYLHMTRDLVDEVTRHQINHFGDIITEVPQ